MAFRDDRQDELYCPICGQYDPKIVQGKHKCEPQEEDTPQEDENQVGYYDPEDETWRKTYGERLENGFNKSH